MRWPGAFIYMPWILEWNIEEFKIHIHCCFKNICPKNISSGRYERGQNSYRPLLKKIKVPTNGGNLCCFSYSSDSSKVYLIHTTKLRVYNFKFDRGTCCLPSKHCKISYFWFDAINLDEHPVVLCCLLRNDYLVCVGW